MLAGAMARKSIVVGLVLLAGLFALWRVGDRAPRARDAVEAVASEPAGEADPAAPAVLEFEEPARRELEIASEAPAIGVATAQPSPPTGAEPRAREPKTLELHGTLVVVDVDSTELTDLDAKFSLACWQGSHGQINDVDVRSGRWSTTIDTSLGFTALEVHRVNVGERVATVLLPTGSFSMPEDGLVRIRAQFPRPMTLRVLDAESGIELGGVAIVFVGESHAEGEVHPGVEYDSRVLGRGLQSPVTLDPKAPGFKSYTVTQLLVGAEGYAWTKLSLDSRLGGERAISLRPGADLAVRVRGVDPDAAARLRLFGEAAYDPMLSVPLVEDGLLEFRGLEPGPGMLRAQIGDYTRSPVLLGETEVVLRVGARAEAELVLQPAPTLETATAAGTVYVAKEWSSTEARLELDLLDTPLGSSETTHRFEATSVPSDRPGFDAFAWTVPGLQVGNYELELSSPRTVVAIEVPHGGRRDHVLVVTSPVELLVRVLDATTEKDVLTDQLHWHPVLPPGVSSWSHLDASYSKERQGYVIRSPAVRIAIYVTSWDYLPYDTTIDLSLGLREHVIRLDRSCGITLRLVDGETALAFPAGWHQAPKSVAYENWHILSRTVGFVKSWMLSEPGTYTIELPVLAGYEPPGTATIEVFAGKFTEYVVSMVRESP